MRLSELTECRILQTRDSIALKFVHFDTMIGRDEGGGGEEVYRAIQ